MPEAQGFTSTSARFSRCQVSELSGYQLQPLVPLVDEFAGRLFGELDYVAEGHNCEKFARLYRNVPRVGDGPGTGGHAAVSAAGGRRQRAWRGAGQEDVYPAQVAWQHAEPALRKLHCSMQSPPCGASSTRAPSAWHQPTPLFPYPDFDQVRCPGIKWDCTSRRVLTMEWIDGVKLTDQKGEGCVHVVVLWWLVLAGVDHGVD